MNTIATAEVSRREFIQRSAAGAAGLALGAGLAPLAQAAPGSKIPIGVQLYSVRDQCAKDLPGTLAAVAKIGFKGVEFAGYHGRSAKELRKMLDDLGIVACGTHTPYETVLGDKLKETVEFNRTIGNKFLIVPWMEGKTKQAWLDKAKLFNEIADKLKADGMLVGYHAHAHDFHKIEGETTWDVFASNTKAEVILQMDTSNCRDGGGDPIAAMQKYPGRTKSIHIKPNGGGPEAVYGEDKLDWKSIFEICEGKGGTDWYVVEHESSKEPIGTVRRCYETLKKMDKV